MYSKKYCNDNPCDSVIKKYKPTERDVVILTVDKSTEFMRICESKFQGLTLYHALQLFGGLRPDEARLMTWENIHEDEGHIYVPKSISKVCDDRNIDITPTLKLWLKTFKGERKGFVTRQTNFSNIIKKYRYALGYSVKIPVMVKGKYKYLVNEGAPDFVPDCCRHSFASYMLATGTTRGVLAEQMGNSREVIKNHYKKIVPRKEGEKFFAIIPCEALEAAKAKDEKMKRLRNRVKQLKQQ